MIIETDLGRDPDDLFAIIHLMSKQIDIQAILISPGDLDQVAIAKMLCNFYGLKIPVGVAKNGRTKKSSNKFHYDLLEKYKFPLVAEPDGLGIDILEDLMSRNSDVEFFAIGPVTSIGTYLQKHPEREILKATMQGGFLPYSIYRPKQTSEKFNGKETMPTFNLNGDRINGVNFLNGNVKKRRMVGKNVCHNVIFTKELAQRSSGLFLEAANLYFSFDRDKKFHDPTAAICHLHPEIGCWIKGKTIKMNDGWTTIEHGEDEILADLDHELFWEILLN